MRVKVVLVLVLAVAVTSALAIAVVITAGVVVAARVVRDGLQAHAEALAGYWSTNKAAETAFVSLDDVVAEWNLQNPGEQGMVLESDSELEELLDD